MPSGHGVSKGLVDTMFAQTKLFFSQSRDHKMQIHCADTPNRGYFDIGGENLGDKKVGDYKEGVDIGLDAQMKKNMPYAHFSSSPPLLFANYRLQLSIASLS